MISLTCVLLFLCYTKEMLDSFHFGKELKKQQNFVLLFF